MRARRVAICLIISSVSFAIPTPGASQPAVPSFADSAAVLYQVGLRVGRRSGPVRVAPRLTCPSECPEAGAEEDQPHRLAARFRAGVEAETPRRAWMDDMPVVQPTPYVSASPPRFDRAAGVAVVEVRIEDAWGPPVVTAWFLRRTGESWEVAGSSGTGRAWPLERGD